MKSRIAFFFLAVLFFTSAAFAGIRIKAKITTADGRAPELAHVHVAEPGNMYHYAFLSKAADADGQFEITVEKPGYYSMWITAVNHYATEIIVAAENDGETLEFEVAPAPYRYLDRFDEVKIVGDWNQFQFSSAEPMQRHDDGTFSYRVKAKADTLAYQLLGIEHDGHSVNGTMQDYFAYDGSGDYRSVLKTKPGQEVSIIFDPDRLVRLNGAASPKVTFDASHRWLEQAFALLQRNEAFRADYVSAMKAYRKQHGGMEEFTFDASEYLNDFRERARSAVHSFLRSLAHVLRYRISFYSAGNRLDSTEYVQILSDVSPASPAWGYAVNLLSTIPGRLGKARGDEYLSRMQAENPLTTVQAHVIVTRAAEAKARGDKARWKTLYSQLQTYKDAPQIWFYLKYLDPNKKIAAGNPVPDFEVKLMDSDQTVSKTSLLGKYYLLDFWATWCGPCIGEMPVMHKAWEKFKDKNFVILSLSFDQNPDIVKRFREKKWKMPWLHTFVEGGFNSELAKTFEVLGIPKPILVSPKGIILATEDELRGPNLEKTLAGVLENTATKDE